MANIKIKVAGGASEIRAFIYTIASGAIDAEWTEIAILAPSSETLEINSGQRCAVHLVAYGAADDDATVVVKQGGTELLDPSPCKVVVTSDNVPADMVARFNVA